MASRYYYRQNDQTHGPFSSAQLRDLVRANVLKPEALVWKEGAKKWMSATDVKGLFPDANPPVPPSRYVPLPGAPPALPLHTPPASPAPPASAGPPTIPAHQRSARSGSRKKLILWLSAGGGALLLLSCLVILLLVLGSGSDRSRVMGKWRMKKSWFGMRTILEVKDRTIDIYGVEGKEERPFDTASGTWSISRTEGKKVFLNVIMDEEPDHVRGITFDFESPDQARLRGVSTASDDELFEKVK